MTYASDLPTVHSAWKCGYRYGFAEECPVSCMCSCHDAQQANHLRNMGLHVHRWVVRAYPLEGKPLKVSIRCPACGMSVRRGTEPAIIDP